MLIFPADFSTWHFSLEFHLLLPMDGIIGDGLKTLWRNAKREVQTTVGRRASGRHGQPTARPPERPGGQGLVVQESSDGWDVVERRPVTERRQRPAHAATTEGTTASGAYFVAGEAGAAAEEDAEYRRIWNLPQPSATVAPQSAAAAPRAINRTGLRSRVSKGAARSSNAWERSSAHRGPARCRRPAPPARAPRAA